MLQQYQKPSLAHTNALPTELLDLAQRLRDPSILTFAEGDAVGLANGLAGIALLPLTLAPLFPGQGWLEVAGSYFRRIAQETRRSPLSHPGLYHGSCGVALTLSLLARLDARYDEASRILLARLVDQVITWDWATQPFLPGQQNFELIGGAAGILRFLLTQQAEPGVSSALECLLSSLLWVSEKQDRWVHRPERLGTMAKQRYPAGYIDLGRAHGLAGPLAALSLAALHGYAHPGVLKAIERWSAWLLEQRLNMPWGKDWPAVIPTHLQAKDCLPARSAWCYGAPGIAHALWLAGRALTDDSLCTLARESLAAVFRRPAEARHIDEPQLCHGLAGLLLVCRRMASDDPTACPAWLKEAISQLTTAFTTRWIASSAQMPPTFLSGSVGGALTLLAVMTTDEPLWDQALLLS
ncbi:MAG: lanthionine synthetase C family protein [Ktedonobacteraceae bacterium]|nr:lanthionine synthetase C family protein [Ktedonobacteraceae bacterium]